jgi:4-methylaminobutanoate oxidase (formaldehyde-forming)
MFAVVLDKPGSFIGREALARAVEAPVRRRLVQFLLRDPRPLLYHDEPIWCDGVLAGRTTSGAYGHHLGAAVALGYVCDGAGIDAVRIANSAFEIEEAGVRHAATTSLRPLYDPRNSRIRA